MKSLLLSLLIIAILVVIALRPWVRRPEGEKGGGPPPERFMGHCRSTAINLQSPDRYCGCLWQRGIRSPGETLSSGEGQRIAAECAKVAGVDLRP